MAEALLVDEHHRHCQPFLALVSSYADSSPLPPEFASRVSAYASLGRGRAADTGMQSWGKCLWVSWIRR